MSEHVYDEAHVVISRLIGRKYNNPLGEAVFPLLDRLAGCGKRPLRVLDVGCGRGWTTLWWARQGARVWGFDPSPEMLKEARLLLEEGGVADAVTLVCTDTAGFQAEGGFDLVIVHDVLCYTPDFAADLDRILGWCRSGGVLSITNYFGEAEAASVTEIAGAWGIQLPRPFAEQQSRFEALPARVLALGETTRHYRAHWAEMRRRLTRQRAEVAQAVGEAALARFEHQISTIEGAIEDRQFGHLWVLLEAGPAA